MSSPSSREISPVTPRPHPARDALRWLLVFPAFPLSGLLITTVIGPIDAPLPALGGGFVVGLAVGAAQLLGLRGRAHTLPWLLASGVGGALGLLAGSTLVGHGTTLPALAVQGLLTGALLGSAQALALPRDARRALWAGGVALLWGLGWVVTTLAGIDVERQYAVFGASGALIATLGFALLGAVTLDRTPVTAGSTESATS
jgi:hypothetical protein